MGKQGEATNGGHNNLRMGAAAAGIVGLSVAAAYYAHRGRQDKFRPDDPERQRQASERMTELLGNPRLKNRDLISEIAFRVYYARRETAAVVMPKDLREQVGGHVGRHALQDAIGHLRQRDFIKTVPTGGRGRRGYQATEDLAEVFQQIEDFSDLADAQNRILGAAQEAGVSEYYEQDLDEN